MAADMSKTRFISDVAEDDSRKLSAASAIVKSGDCGALAGWLDENRELLAYPVCNKYGDASLLHHAAKHGTLEMCEHLLRRGVDVNYASPVMELFPYVTPLVNAAGEGKQEMVRFLCESGAWIDGHPRCNLTPLMAACISGHGEVVEYLLTHAPDVARTHNSKHKTALDFARTRNHGGIVEALERRGAPPAFERMVFDDYRAPGIMACVWEGVGQIFSADFFTRRHDGGQIDVRMALVDNGNKNKIVFTIGAYERIPRREFIISLPYDWPLNNALLGTNDGCAFPVETLFALAAYRLDGNEVDEGFIVSRDAERWRHLRWPENIDGLVAVDCSFADPKSTEIKSFEINSDGDSEDTARLLCLAPLKFPKSGPYRGDKLKAWIDQRRYLRSSRLPLKEWRE